jgi:hypothetical protein
VTDWQTRCLATATAAGRVTADVFDEVRQHINADGDVDWAEAEFLVRLRNAAPASAPLIHQYVFQATTRAVLRDGGIGPQETAWLRQTVFTDGQLDKYERAFLDTLKDAAVTTCPEFDRLVSDYVSV